MIDACVMVIACGHEDCDDLDVMRHEAMLKMFCGKTLEAEVGLASQPTLSRLENTVSWRTLAQMGVKMIEEIFVADVELSDPAKGQEPGFSEDPPVQHNESCKNGEYEYRCNLR